jgi:hypothetical protein
MRGAGLMADKPENMKRYRLLDGNVRVRILKGTNQAEAAQALREAAEEVEKTPASTWEKWDKSAE